MTASEKLNVLQETSSGDEELNRVLDKLLDVSLSDCRSKLLRYDQVLEEFEQRYGMDSELFSRRFEAGELGDGADFFEWMGLFKLREDMVGRIARLETAH